MRAAIVPLAGAALLLAATDATAAPGSLRLVGVGPTYGDQIAIAAAGGGTFTSDPGLRTVTLTSATGAVTSPAWCVDRTRRITGGIDYRVDVQTPGDTPELGTPGMQAAAWLIGRADQLLAQAADRSLEAAAVQVAVWRLTGQAADVRDVTPDAALNARADALRWQAQGMAPATALALQAPAGPGAVGAPAELTVTGTPRADVDLAVASGAGALTATHVTIGAAGAAVVDLTPSAPGTVVVDATTTGGTLIRAAHIGDAPAPQDMAIVLPRPLAAQASVLTPAAAVTPPFAPVSTAQRPARLRLRKTGPARVAFAHVIPYTLTVTNRSSVTADDVVVRDPVPGGATVGRLPARARLDGGAVVWNLGDLAPGASVTVHLRLHADVASVRRVLNVARASASNAATVRARALTVVVAPRRVAPARIPVTG
ncbi:MAG TPA: hypothetical protein VL422_13260 [Miltoncostaea sp.]|nr:hypothetical protein [Miltoncostaea sp.]